MKQTNIPKRVNTRHRKALTTFGARLPAFVFGPNPPEARARIGALSVAVGGCGSIGIHLIDLLARMGVSSILCADPACFKAESLLTHPLVGPAVLGASKASFAARHASRLNPTMDVRFVVGALQDVPLTELRRYNVLICATDSLESEIALGQLSLRLNVPLIRAAVEGQTLTAQVAFYSNRADGPCPGCLFGPSEWARSDARHRFSCGGDSSGKVVHEPTMSIPSLCCMAADLAVQQLIRVTLGLGSPVLDTMAGFSGYINDLSVTRLVRREHCPCDHRPFTQVILRDRLGAMTIADIMAASRFVGSEKITIELEGYVYAARAACECGRLPPAGRFLRCHGEVAACSACGLALKPAYHVHRAVSPRQLGAQGLHTVLRHLGAGAVRCVVITSSTHGALILERSQKS